MDDRVWWWVQAAYSLLKCRRQADPVKMIEVVLESRGQV